MLRHATPSRIECSSAPIPLKLRLKNGHLSLDNNFRCLVSYFITYPLGGGYVLFYTLFLTALETQFGRTSTFKMAADLKKMACAIFFKMP